jgi:hypothetical protein
VNLNNWFLVIGIGGGAVTALVALGALLRKGWAVWRKVSAFLDELVGEPAQFGRNAKPGLIERLDKQDVLLTGLHKEMHPNGGSSVRDSLNRLEVKATEAAETAKEVKADLARHTAETAAAMTSGQAEAARIWKTFDEQNKAITNLADAVNVAARSTPPAEEKP